MFFGKKKNPHDTACLVCHVVIAVLLFLAALAALVGVIMSHYGAMLLAQDSGQSAMMLFGTNAGSLSLIAFAFTTAVWVKSLKSCMMACDACGTNGKK